MIALRNRQAVAHIKYVLRTAYGFVADPTKSKRYNSYTVLCDMPTWFYFGRPNHTAFHTFCEKDTKVPKNLEFLLGLGTKFIPTPYFTNHDMKTTFRRLERDLKLRTYFAGPESTLDDEDYDKKIYVPSKWVPKHWMIPTELTYRLSRLRRNTEALFRKKCGKSNLLPTQRRLLQTIRNHEELMVVNCDKNLGPAIIERDKYIILVLEHLSDEKTYMRLNDDEVKLYIDNTNELLNDWISNFDKYLSQMEKKYLKTTRTNNLPYFYMTIKAHKTPWSLRPITACKDTILSSLGVLVDRWLQQVATTMPSYFKNSKSLKEHLEKLDLPPDALLFTADARSMYTCIDTEAALVEIPKYLRANKKDFPDVPVEALIEGITIIMQNNLFTLGDTYWLQKTGAAMGQPPSPSYATVFYGIHETRIGATFSTAILPLYKRYIDDVIGVWVPPRNNRINERSWKTFGNLLNGYHGLKWDISVPTRSVDYMDLTVHVRNGRIYTDLYEKELNLYLYIPPLSAHPPGTISGLVLGNCYRIHTLVTRTTDRNRHLRAFYQRLLHRGYKSGTIDPLFRRAATAAKERAATAVTTIAERTNPPIDERPIFFHLKYHPDDPPSRTIQKYWRKFFSEPGYEKPFRLVRNLQGNTTGIKRLIVAYSRAPNLCNILSRNKLIATPNCPAVSTYATYVGLDT